MLVLPKAKILLYIALQLGPAHPSMIYATSNSESYVWEPTSNGWSLVAKGFPSSDFTRDPAQSLSFAGGAPVDGVPSYLHAVGNYSWKRNGALVFENGDRIEKHGDHAFYIINAGGANEQDFTILYPHCH